MFIHMLLAWLALAGLLLTGIFLLVVAHFLYAQIGKRRKTAGKLRVPIFLVSAGFAFLQFFSDLCCPGAKHLLAEKCREDKDEDDEGDPDHPEEHLDGQLKRIRRGDKTDDLVLRL